jgi:hypothetical protein
LASSLLLIGAIICVHAYFKELRTTLNGKFLLIFSISLFVYYLALSIARTSASFFLETEEFLILVGGFCFSFIWMTAMNFDVFWSLEYFSSPTDSQKSFKVYCLITFVGVVAIMAMFYETLITIEVFKDLLVVALAANVALIALAGFKMFQLSKKVNTSDTSRFKEESDR